MKILVPIKRVADPDKADKVTVSPDGTKVICEGLEEKPNPFDEYAVEAALRILEDGVGSGKLRGEIVVVTVGHDDAVRQLRQCMAMGADRGILVQGCDDELDAGVVATALSRVIEKEQPHLVITGKLAVDSDSNQVAQTLAEILGWPQATFAGELEAPEDLSSVMVTREVDGGVVRVKVHLPAVISVDLRVVSPTGVKNNVAGGKAYQDGPRFASLKGIMNARKKPVDILTMADLDVDTTLKVRTVRFSRPPMRSGGVIVETTQDLIARLRDEARVLQGKE